MSQRRDSLSPPERPGTQITDPGARELDAVSDSDDHFSDAQSGPVESSRASPIPRTRVEKVDDSPSYGEVPGTEAYRKREGDAAPDEIAIIPDPDSAKLEAPDSGALGGAGAGGGGAGDVSPISRPSTPGGHPIPKTVVEEAPDSPGSVTHQGMVHRRRSDPPPDVLLKADGSRVRAGEESEEEKEKEGDAPLDSPITTILQSPSSPTRTRRKSSTTVRPHGVHVDGAGSDHLGDHLCDDVGDGFGDDFDDFEEGGEDGDFGDFDEGFRQPVPTAAPASMPTAPAPPPPSTVPLAMSISFPIPEFDDLDPAEIFAAIDPFLDALFPPDEDDSELYHVHEITQDDPHSRAPRRSLAPDASTNPVFLTPRSASLWSQLVAPPPLQPPDWIRSRIRRLFLVSLGVPVDLDEILPASTKQKKLILPSLRRPGSTGSLRTTLSADSRGRSSSGRRPRHGTSSTGKEAAGRNSTNGDGGGVAGASASGGSAAAAAAAAATGQGEANSSFSSSKQQQQQQPQSKTLTPANAGGTGAGPSATGSPARKGPPPEPRFNLVSARQLCATTDEALNGMTDDELRAHVWRLEAMEGTAKEALEYWTKRTDEKIGDREAFEGVIENLVKHARKVRK